MMINITDIIGIILLVFTAKVWKSCIDDIFYIEKNVEGKLYESDNKN